MAGDLAEIARYMRMGRALPEGPLAERVRRLESIARPLVRPRQIRRRIPLGPASPFPRLQGLIDASRVLSAHLAHCHGAYLLCATIGPAIDALHRRLSVLSGVDALIVQAIGAAAIEAYVDRCEESIRNELHPGETLVSRYSPGYGDFPLEAQTEFFSILDPPRAIGVSLTDTELMVPTKSVTAIIGIRRLEPPWAPPIKEGKRSR